MEVNVRGRVSGKEKVGGRHRVAVDREEGRAQEGLVDESTSFQALIVWFEGCGADFCW
jgi:hypothetical protein